MKKYCLLFLIVLAWHGMFAQCTTNKLHQSPSANVVNAFRGGQTIELGENIHPYGGTFQFIISKNADSKEIFTTEILQFIESKRQMNQDVVISLSKNTKVLILSKNKISDPNFKALANLYRLEE